MLLLAAAEFELDEDEDFSLACVLRFDSAKYTA
jgi:hypothetical protein